MTATLKALATRIAIVCVLLVLAADVIKWVKDTYQGDIAGNPVHAVFLSCSGEWFPETPATVSITVDMDTGTVNYEDMELHIYSRDGNQIYASGYLLGRPNPEEYASLRLNRVTGDIFIVGLRLGRSDNPDFSGTCKTTRRLF
jgi:hypothetical protein